MKSRFGGRVGQILVGILIMIVSIVVYVLITSLISPPTYSVVVALRDIEIGEPLLPGMVTTRLVDIDDPSPYILAEEIELYGFHYFIERVGAGELVPKGAISFADSAAVDSRVAAALADPDMVAIAIPVTRETAPSRIVIGDRVDITLTVGAATFLTGAFEPVPTAAPQTYTSPGGSENPYLTPQPTPTQVPVVHLPVSKTLISGARVLRIEYEQQFNPGASAEESPGFIRGEIQTIVVAVPRYAQEALAFAIWNGVVTITVVDPNAPTVSYITPGMSWDDLVEFFTVERAYWVETAQPPDGQLHPPGADVVGPTVVAPLHGEEGGFPPTPTPTVTPFLPSATPTP